MTPNLTLTLQNQKRKKEMLHQENRNLFLGPLKCEVKKPETVNDAR